jgi:hypothetical protein
LAYLFYNKKSIEVKKNQRKTSKNNIFENIG